MEADHVDSLSRLQAGRPYLRDSPEKDHAMVSRAGSDGAVRLEER
jgi:hypothetical protein